MKTIQEVFVVAATLGLHGYPDEDHPELVERYQRHHEVFTGTVAEDLIATGGAHIGETLNEEVLDALGRKRQDRIGVYGKKFGSAWGWAAPIFPASKSPSFTALSTLILPTFNAFYGIASSQLHASSQGLIEAERLIESGGKHFFAGAQTDGLAVPAILGSGFLVGEEEAHGLTPRSRRRCGRRSEALAVLRTHKVVQERLGHSTITTTMNIYSHATPTMQKAAVSLFGLSRWRLAHISAHDTTMAPKPGN